MVAALNFSRRSLVVAWTGLMLVGPLSLVAEAQKTTALTIFAAASLKNALDSAA